MDNKKSQAFKSLTHIHIPSSCHITHTNVLSMHSHHCHSRLFIQGEGYDIITRSNYRKVDYGYVSTERQLTLVTSASTTVPISYQ